MFKDLSDERYPQIPLAFPDLGGNEIEYISDAVHSSWVSSTGPYITSFENNFSSYCDVNFGISTSNGTTALHLSLISLGIGPGDEVIVPDLTFAATINAVLHAGATPVIVDVDPDTLLIDPEKIKAAISPNTRAVICVHLFGSPCDMNSICSLCKDGKIFLIEDCAQAHGATYNNKKVGSFGDIGCFSFFGNKIITTGEGGMCVTNSEELRDKMRILRDHGMDPDRRYIHNVVGYNYRMTNIQAALGVAQLENIDKSLIFRSKLKDSYKFIFRNSESIVFLNSSTKQSNSVTWLVTAFLMGIKRDDLVNHMNNYNIDIRPIFPRLSSMDIYKEYSCFIDSNCNALDGGIFLPTHPHADVSQIFKIFLAFS